MSLKERKLSVKQVATHRVAPGVTPGFIKHYLESLDCPRALTVWLLFSNREHDQLVELECDPVEYSDVFDFRASYAATCFLSKFKRLSLNLDPKREAYEKFMRYETHCRKVNRRFVSLETDVNFKDEVVWLHDAVIRKISEILGPIDYEALFDVANWGPGASTLLKREVASSANKFQCETGITRDLYHALNYRGAFDLQYPLWAKHLSAQGSFPTFCVGNKVVTVPKNAKIDRVIAIEPGLNLWFQKAVGEILNGKLRKVGIDLRYQKRNQSLAYSSSLDGKLATVDFSSASDCISLEVVRSLLPPDWFQLLDVLRSRYGVQEGSSVRWNKFSSMGNGFTFQLESLIFFAVASCCEEFTRPPQTQRRTVSVYGDDVIVPVDSLELFVKLSAFYGFVVNKEKSFSSTYFRESCGAHWANGIDVKPVYLKDKLSTLCSVYRAANAVRRQAHRWGNTHFCDSRFKRCFDFLVSSVPKKLQLRIPESLGDGGFISNFDEASPVRARHWIEGFFVLHVQEKARKRPFDGEGLLLSSLWANDAFPERSIVRGRQPSHLAIISKMIRQSQEMNNFSLLHGATEISLTRSLVASWYDLGPWI